MKLCILYYTQGYHLPGPKNKHASEKNVKTMNCVELQI